MQLTGPLNERVCPFPQPSNGALKAKPYVWLLVWLSVWEPTASGPYSFSGEAYMLFFFGS